MIKPVFALIDSEIKNLSDGFPQKTFPKRVESVRGDLELVGYFANYDNKFTTNSLFDEILSNGFVNLVNSNSEFLLLWIDRKSKELTIAVDQANAFSCYFSIFDKKLVMSTSFAEVKNYWLEQKRKLHLDPDGLFTGLLWEWHTTERTLLDEIKILPAGCIAKFDLSTMKYTLKSLIDLEEFLSLENSPYGSMREFARDWLDIIKTVVKGRLDQINEAKFGSDLSSGFDCTLIAYLLSQLVPDLLLCFSRHSEIIPGETNVGLMRLFAQAHKLKLKSIDVTTIHLQNEDLEELWSIDDPYQVVVTDHEDYLSLLENESIKVQFAGEGGDEAYCSREIDLLGRFPIQNSFFMNVMYLKKRGLERLFTHNAIDYALGHERFNQRQLYPMIAPVSSAVPSVATSWRYWERDIWQMMPFFDTRVIGLARRMPMEINGNMQDKKFAVVKEMTEIFPREMFISKKGHEDTFVNFPRKQKRLILAVLENSILNRIGWIDKDKLISMLENENSEIYNPEFAIVFQNMIMLDWFMQKNEIGD